MWECVQIQNKYFWINGTNLQFHTSKKVSEIPLYIFCVVEYDTIILWVMLLAWWWYFIMVKVKLLKIIIEVATVFLLYVLCVISSLDCILSRVKFVRVKDCGIFTVHKRTSHVKEITWHKSQTGESLVFGYVRQ